MQSDAAVANVPGPEDLLLSAEHTLGNVCANVNCLYLVFYIPFAECDYTDRWLPLPISESFVIRNI